MPVGKRFVKGQVANPLGGRAHNPEVQKIRTMTKVQVAEIGQLILEGDIKKIQAVKDNPKSSVLQIWIAAVAVKAITKGDMAALNQLLDRIVGKVRDDVHVTGSGIAPQVLVTLPMNGREAPKDESNEKEGG